MGFTTSYANTILKNLVSGASIGLSQTTPNASGGNITEPDSSDGYKRVVVNSTIGAFSASERVLTNDAYVYFPEATASWGTITHMCIYDSSGTLRYFGKLNSSVSVAANTVPLFKPGTISIALDAD